jgi:hypothetical protein
LDGLDGGPARDVGGFAGGADDVLAASGRAGFGGGGEEIADSGGESAEIHGQ